MKKPRKIFIVFAVLALLICLNLPLAMDILEKVSLRLEIAMLDMKESIKPPRNIPANYLSLEIKSDKEIYRIGEPINFNLTFKNVSRKRFKLFHPVKACYMSWHLKLIVQTPDGQKETIEPHGVGYASETKDDFKNMNPDDALPFLIKFNSRPADVCRWVVLGKAVVEHPSKKSEIIDVLTEVFNREGPYTVTVEYENLCDYFEASCRRFKCTESVYIRNAWTGKLSGSTTLTIVK